jgi:hypothetical protein
VVDDAARDLTLSDELTYYGLQPEVSLKIAREFEDQDVDSWFIFECKFYGEMDSIGYFGMAL